MANKINLLLVIGIVILVFIALKGNFNFMGSVVGSCTGPSTGCNSFDSQENCQMAGCTWNLVESNCLATNCITCEDTITMMYSNPNNCDINTKLACMQNLQNNYPNEYSRVNNDGTCDILQTCPITSGTDCTTCEDIKDVTDKWNSGICSNLLLASCSNNLQTNYATEFAKYSSTTNSCSGSLCTTESGSLCLAATKIIADYTDGCQKSSLIGQGYSTDLTLCEEEVCTTNQECYDAYDSCYYTCNGTSCNQIQTTVALPAYPNCIQQNNLTLTTCWDYSATGCSPIQAYNCATEDYYQTEEECNSFTSCPDFIKKLPTYLNMGADCNTGIALLVIGIALIIIAAFFLFK